MKSTYDCIIVGAGILGLAHAWRAALRHQRVLVLERSPLAVGASVRNFGMVWPIGQPMGELHSIAMQSRQMWLELADAAGVWVNPCGSLHLAHADDEWTVLEEFQDLASAAGLDTKLYDAPQTLDASSAVQRHGLRGSLFSPSELCVNPTEAIRRLAVWLQESQRVDVQFSTVARDVQSGTVTTSDGRVFQAMRIIICGGDDLRSLFPEQFAAAGIRVCKLQMLRTVVQPNRWRMGPHLASGLTLRHYDSFRACPSLPALRQRIQQQTPELEKYGIHVMASQNDVGQVVLGDSHQYDHDIEPFDRVEIDELILRELRRQIDLPDWTIDRRWHGCYAKPRENPLCELTPTSGVTMFVSPGGAGMTLSFGWAERFWQRELGSVRANSMTSHTNAV